MADIKYDGRFTFARVQFTTGPGGYYYQGLPAWAHGYSRGERHLTRILEFVSDLDVHTDGSKVLKVTDADLCKYPVAYITEVGYLNVTDEEVAALRAYLLKGGFLIVDDFRDDFQRGNSGFSNFTGVLSRVMPASKLVRLDGAHPIFHSFFDIDKPESFIPAYDRGGPPEFYGLYEDNNPSKRLQMIVNFNNDLSDYWEFSERGYAVSNANEAYKLGVNYIIYGLTH